MASPSAGDLLRELARDAHAPDRAMAAGTIVRRSLPELARVLDAADALRDWNAYAHDFTEGNQRKWNYDTALAALAKELEAAR